MYLIKNSSELASYIEFTNLSNIITENEMKDFLNQAKEYPFRSVVVSPTYVPLAKEEMKDTDTKVVTVIGNAEVRQTFKISNVGTIAGCYVTNGKVARNAGVRVIRENVVIHDGKLISLKRMKDDAKEVASGYECGIQIEDFNDIKEGDVIEAYIMEQVKQ